MVGVTPTPVNTIKDGCDLVIGAALLTEIVHTVVVVIISFFFFFLSSFNFDWHVFSESIMARGPLWMITCWQLDLKIRQPGFGISADQVNSLSLS